MPLRHPQWSEAHAAVLAAVRAGHRWIAVLGPSGTGKTLLLRSLVPTLADRGAAVVKNVAEPGRPPELVVPRGDGTTILIDDGDRLDDGRLAMLAEASDAQCVFTGPEALAERLGQYVPEVKIVILATLSPEGAHACLAEWLLYREHPPNRFKPDATTDLITAAAGVPRALLSLAEHADWLATEERVRRVRVRHVREAVQWAETRPDAALFDVGPDDGEDEEEASPRLAAMAFRTLAWTGYAVVIATAGFFVVRNYMAIRPAAAPSTVVAELAPPPAESVRLAARLATPTPDPAAAAGAAPDAAAPDSPPARAATASARTDIAASTLAVPGYSAGLVPTAPPPAAAAPGTAAPVIVTSPAAVTTAPISDRGAPAIPPRRTTPTAPTAAIASRISATVLPVPAQPPAALAARAAVAADLARAAPAPPLPPPPTATLPTEPLRRSASLAPSGMVQATAPRPLAPPPDRLTAPSPPTQPPHAGAHDAPLSPAVASLAAAAARVPAPAVPASTAPPAAPKGLRLAAAIPIPDPPQPRNPMAEAPARSAPVLVASAMATPLAAATTAPVSGRAAPEMPARAAAPAAPPAAFARRTFMAAPPIPAPPPPARIATSGSSAGQARPAPMPPLPPASSEPAPSHTAAPAPFDVAQAEAALPRKALPEWVTPERVVPPSMPERPQLAAPLDAPAVPGASIRAMTAALAPSPAVPASAAAPAAPKTLRLAAAIPIPDPPQPDGAKRGAAEKSAPGLLLIARSGETLSSLYAKVYRGVVPPPFEAVAAVNPKRVKPGDVLVFPPPPQGWKPERTADRGAT